jgi:glycosyltransferase involved in cell wall biosynthesis
VKISIIIPSFNQGQFIEETLLSIINQEGVDKEIIVIDGGSTDDTVNVIKKYEKHISFWISEDDKGQSEAINKGFIRATGDIICWLNSDDLFEKDALSKVFAFFEKNEDKMFVQGQVVNFSSKEEKTIPAERVDDREMIKRVAFHQPGVFWRRGILKDSGFIDESLYYCMDYDLWMRFYFNFELGYIDEPLARFRIHDSSKTNDNPIKMYFEYRKIVCRFFNSVSPESVKTLKSLDLYDNNQNIAYKIEKESIKTPVSDLLNVFINECAIQEYSQGNVKRANQLFSFVLNKEPNLETLLFKVKNWLGVRKFSKMFKQS